jgi:hypothetical protein
MRKERVKLILPGKTKWNRYSAGMKMGNRSEEGVYDTGKTEMEQGNGTMRQELEKSKLSS